MMEMAAIELLIDVTDKTEDGFYNGSFDVDESRQVRMYIKNNGDVPITVKVKKGKTNIVDETIKANGQKEITKNLTDGSYSFSIDAKGSEVGFQFRAVGLD